MKKIQTISREVKVNQSVDSDNFDISFQYRHNEKERPDLITASANSKNKETPGFKVDVSFYPSTNNLQIVCQNTPADFNAATINEILPYIRQIVAAL